MSDLATLAGVVRSLVVYRARPWRRRALAGFYRALLADGALAFDVGAHVGNRTRALLDAGARCVALEPQPAFASLLERTFAREPRATLEAVAVGAVPGTATLHVSRRHPTVSTLDGGWLETVSASAGFERVRWDETVEVPVTTLDALIERHGTPDFCKIDVERMEAEILAGLSRPVPLVAVEYLPAALDVAHACIARLAELGDYRFGLVRGEGTRFAHERWLGADEARAALAAAAAGGASGDLYARLAEPPAGSRLRPAST